jgi:hypothetical protein
VSAGAIDALVRAVGGSALIVFNVGALVFRRDNTAGSSSSPARSHHGGGPEDRRLRSLSPASPVSKAVQASAADISGSMARPQGGHVSRHRDVADRNNNNDDDDNDDADDSSSASDQGSGRHTPPVMLSVSLHDLTPLRVAASGVQQGSGSSSANYLALSRTHAENGDGVAAGPVPGPSAEEVEDTQSRRERLRRFDYLGRPRTAEARAEIAAVERRARILASSPESSPAAQVVIPLRSAPHHRGSVVRPRKWDREISARRPEVDAAIRMMELEDERCVLGCCFFFFVLFVFFCFFFPCRRSQHQFLYIYNQSSFPKRCARAPPRHDSVARARQRKGD